MAALLFLKGEIMKALKGEKEKQDRTKRKNVTFDIDTAKTIELLASKNDVSDSEIIRRLVKASLKKELVKEDLEGFSNILNREIQNAISEEKIMRHISQQTNRLAKMMMKVGKVSAGGFYLLLKVLEGVFELDDYDKRKDLYEAAVRLGVRYMKVKDFELESDLLNLEKTDALLETLTPWNDEGGSA